MRIDELHLAAFGPFSDIRLDFSQGKEGFHLVYGDNEAGKSSALRALRYLLYGIPARTQDDFIHPYAKMRIGATLRSADGSPLKLIRRKGRSHTLRAADDASIVDENVLTQLLRGIGEDLFTTLFGIGYEDLVQGGQEIIQGGGNLGRLIFSAGSGIVNLQEIQKELQDAADALFRPSAQKPAINDMLSRFNAYQAALRDAQLPGQDWESHHRSLQQALERKAEVEAELASLQKACVRLKRIEQALPMIAQRSELIKVTADMRSVPELPQDFSEKRQALVTDLGIAEKEKIRAAEAIRSNEQAIAELTVSDMLLEHAELIEELHQELGSQRKAAKDSIQLQTRRDSLRGEAAEILHALKDGVTVEEAEKLRIKKDQIVLIQELSSQYERMVARMEDVREKLPELQQTLQQIDAELAHLPSPLPTRTLQSTLLEAEAYGPLENRSRSEQAEIQALLSSLEKEKHRLGLAEKTFEAVESLAVPSMESIRRFEDRLEGVAQSIKEIEREMDQTRNLLQDTERRIETQRLEQSVPTEEELIKIREARDRGLALIAATLNQEEISPAALDAYLKEIPQGDTLLAVFRAHMHQADEVSDRLRREADRVAARARLLSDQNAGKARLSRLEKLMASAAARKVSLSEEWAVLWRESGIVPRSPREMILWLQRYTAMVEKLGELRSRRAEADRLSQDIDSHRQDLARSLQSLAEGSVPQNATLTHLIALAGQVMEEQALLLQRRNVLLRDKARQEKALAAATLKLETNEANLDQWQRRWEHAVKPIGLMADAMPAQAVAVLEELKVLFDKLKEAGILQKRIEGIRRDETAFQQRVSLLITTIAPDLKGCPAAEAVLEFQNRLKRFRDARSRQQTLEKQMAKDHERLSQAMEKIALVEATLSRMCVEAACQNYQELPEVEKLSSRRRVLKTELLNTEDRLRQISGGATVDEFVQQAGRVDPDALNSDIQLLEEKIDGYLNKKSGLDQIIGRERNELDKMDGSAKAAAIAEEIQFLSGGISTAVEKYACLKIAGKVLSMAIERFRDRSQGPILERASQLFEQMTLGSFKALRAEYDSGGSPVLVGVRQGNGGMVKVEGMSDGTADQLYLALRLAGLETYLERNEPLPFIVDDILISFDNQRAAAALRVLAKLSEKTQIIFFTHHRHLLDSAKASVDASMLFQHYLDSGSHSRSFE
jgi:uncharacterized protein YhaN